MGVVLEIEQGVTWETLRPVRSALAVWAKDAKFHQPWAVRASVSPSAEMPMRLVSVGVKGVNSSCKQVKNEEIGPKRKFLGRTSRGHPGVIRADIPAQNFGQGGQKPGKAKIYGGRLCFRELEKAVAVHLKKEPTQKVGTKSRAVFGQGLPVPVPYVREVKHVAVPEDNPECLPGSPPKDTRSSHSPL